MGKAADFKLIKTGTHADIRLAARADEEFESVQNGRDERSLSRARSLERFFQVYCDFQRPPLNDQQFKRQGSFSAGGGGSVVVYEFKAWQWRLYGVVLNIAGRKTFVGLRVDPDKKKDKADRALLEAVARDAGELDEFLNELPGGKDGKNQKHGRRGKR